MPKIRVLLASLVIALTPNIANAQYDDSPSGAGAWNTCWALEKGIPFAVAFKMGIDPFTSMIDERGEQPIQMKRNFLILYDFFETLGRLPKAEQDSRQLLFIKDTLRKILQMCPNKLGASETKEIRESLSAAPNSKVKKQIVDKKKGMQENKESFFKSALEKYRSGNYQGAIADYGKVIAIDPQDAIAFFNRGLAKDNLKDYQSAIADYGKAIAIDPQIADALYSRGRAKIKLEDYRGAISDFGKVVAIDAKDADAYRDRGYAKFNLDNYQDAIADYGKAIAIDENDANAYRWRGLAKYHLEDYQGAIVDYSKAISINPQDGNSFDYRVGARIKLKDYEGACADLKKAASLKQQNATNYLNGEDGAWCRDM